MFNTGDKVRFSLTEDSEQVDGTVVRPSGATVWVRQDSPYRFKVIGTIWILNPGAYGHKVWLVE